ncbi:uncharacterized protein [Medicago truncatula]|uniref:uncharacterized protein n=1 Tax=Medicago truncatula TaxID=3880 RepID=UPI000D2F1CA6|nr:uncharacterized protein LOC112420792 [Medicago truncatula]
MARAGWDAGGGGWEWRRRLFAWEEEGVRDCVNLLHNIVLQDNIQDQWRWLLDPIHGYTVKGTYCFLTNTEVPVTDAVGLDVWHKCVPSKVSVFAWRLLQDRVATRANLVRRRVLQAVDNLCVGGCGYPETADHLFIQCTSFGQVWYLVCQWLGIPCVFQGSVKRHFLQFSQMAGMTRPSHDFMKVIWLACVWAIWKERNNCVFNLLVTNPINIFERVKLLSFLWLSSNVASFSFGFHDWWRYPRFCMGIM